MKKQIINVIIVMVMAIIANYPMYENLRVTSQEINIVVNTIRGEVNILQHELTKVEKEINILMEEFYGFNKEIKQTIDNNLAVADSTLQQIDSTLSIIADSTLAQVAALKSQTDAINKRIDKMVKGNIDKVVNKQYIPGL